MEHELKALKHKEKRLQKLINEQHPLYSDAKGEFDQLKHDRLINDEGTSADTYIHGVYEKKTDILIWRNGRKQSINQSTLPEELYRIIKRAFPRARTIQKA